MSEEAALLVRFILIGKLTGAIYEQGKGFIFRTVLLCKVIPARAVLFSIWVVCPQK